MHPYVVLGVRNAVTCAIANLCRLSDLPYTWATNQAGRGFQPTPGSNFHLPSLDPATHVVTVGLDSFDFVPRLNHPGGETHLSTRMKPVDGQSSGYCQPPARYWEASLLGQFFALGLSGEPTQDERLLAAADYCLTAAYAGKCPGIDPEDLAGFRMKRRIQELMTGEPHTTWATRDISRVWGSIPTTENEWQKAIEATHARTREIVESAPKIRTPGDVPGEEVLLHNLTFRDSPPEVLEVSALNGMAILTRKRVVINQRPQENVALFGCGLETPTGAQPVVQFMAGTIIPRLNHVYGDPFRGFAGGYR